MKKILIFGFGRMGVSHALQICGIYGSRNIDFQLYIVDPSILSRLMAKLILGNVKMQFLKMHDLGPLPKDYFDTAIDCTPPYDREQNIALLSRITKRFLVEKPVLAPLPGSGMSGYVMQHAPLMAHLRKLQRSIPERISCSVVTNLTFSSVKSWRGSQKAGGICREFLGHLLSVPLSCHQSLDKLKSMKVEQRDNFIRLNANIDGVEFDVRFLEGQPVRKTAYTWDFHFPNQSISYDGYSVKKTSENECEVLASMPVSGVSCEYYLRGFDFSNQAVALIDGDGEFLTMNQHALIDNLTNRCAEELRL